MADRDPPARSRRLKIAARVPDNEVPRGKPADWLSKDNVPTVSIVPLFCLHISSFSMGQATSGDWSPGYYFNVI